MTNGSGQYQNLDQVLAAQNGTCQSEYNMGVVRMKTIINGYCPFVAIKDQLTQIVYDAGTVESLPKNIKAKLVAPGNGLPGIFLSPTYDFKSNLIFTNKTLETGCGKFLTKTNTYYTKDKFNSEYGYLPYYSWNNQGSLFSAQTLLPNSNIPSPSTSSPSTPSTPSQNLAQWGYTLTDKFPPIENIPYGSKKAPIPPDSSSVPGILVPSISNTSVRSNSDSVVHWSLQKKRAVFQGTDFFLNLKINSPSNTIQNSSNKLIPSYNFLDSSLPITPGVIPVNGGVIDIDANGKVVPSSVNNYNLNNQVYVIIEIGTNDPNHHYFIVICENSYPIFLHVTTSVPNIVKGSSKKCPFQMQYPTKPVSRRLSSYERALGSDLFAQRDLRIRVQNYMGKIVVWFSHINAPPWVIERYDYTSPPQSLSQGQSQSQNSASANTIQSHCPSGTDPSQFDLVEFPMVVPAAPLGLHGGNAKISFTWGYQTYDSNVTLNIPTPVHIMGSNNHLPTLSDVNLLLGASNIGNGSVGFGKAADLLLNASSDDKFFQDAQCYNEYVGGGPRPTTVWGGSGNSSIACPLTFAAYGKGAVPQQQGSGSGSGSGSNQSQIGDGLSWPPQDIAVPANSYSTIKVDVANGGYGEVTPGEQRAIQFYPEATLISGSFTYPGGDPEVTASKPVKLANVVTPIFTGYAVYIPESGQMWSPQYLDVSSHVLNYNDTWTAQDYSSIEHTGTITFLCNLGMGSMFEAPVGGGRPYVVPNNSAQIVELTDKAFYIQLQCWYDGSSAAQARCGGGPQTPDDDSIIFTGIGYGGKIVYTNGSRVMTSQLHDLSHVLQDQYFLNSPFFNSVNDVVAVYQILRLTGFQGDENSGVPTMGYVQPAGLLAQSVIQSRTGNSPFSVAAFDGCNMKNIYVTSYALPGSYNPLQENTMRFQDGSRYWDALLKMTNYAGKCIYFDRFGIMHYEDRTDQILYQNPGAVSQSEFDSWIKESFYATPRPLTGQPSGTIDPFPNNVQGLSNWKNPFQVAFNTYSWQRDAADVFNRIVVVTATPKGNIDVGGDINFNSLDTPNSTGFLGYTRELINMSGIMGSAEAVRSTVQQLTAAYTPTASLSWESFGRSYLKALDIVYFYGWDPTGDVNNYLNPQPVRITNINTEINPAENKWWSSIQGEWIFAGKSIPNNGSTSVNA